MQFETKWKQNVEENKPCTTNLELSKKRSNNLTFQNNYNYHFFFSLLTKDKYTLYSKNI